MSIYASAYPCDRGIPNNWTARGWHQFEANNAGIICCVLCGMRPTNG